MISFKFKPRYPSINLRKIYVLFFMKTNYLKPLLEYVRIDTYASITGS